MKSITKSLLRKLNLLDFAGRQKRNLFELFRYYGSSITSPMHDKILKYFNYKNGYFIEVGAHDGLYWSNTYFLEKALNWDGLLIEPIKQQYEKCKKNRRVKTLRYALISDTDTDRVKTLKFAGAMSVITESDRCNNEHIKAGLSIQNESEQPDEVVQCIQLSKLVPIEKRINFLSLDVEGFEVEVLKGIGNMDIEYMLIETYKLDEVKTTIPNYTLVEKFSDYDYLFKRMN